MHADATPLDYTNLLAKQAIFIHSVYCQAVY